MDVLILAAGLGSRVSKYTLNIIPKFLINIDDNTGLFYIIKYWEQYTENIYLVIHSHFYEITKFYIDNVIPVNYNHKVKLITYDESDGTAYTLNYLLNNQLGNKIISKNLLITWCDIYPTHNIDFSVINQNNNNNQNNNIHVITHGKKCRYGLKNNEVIFCEKSDGNILGIFYIQNYEKFNLANIIKGNDIVLYLEQIGKINELSIDNIIDYGDEEKLVRIYNMQNKNYSFNHYTESKLKGRYFNKFTILGNKILKEAITEYGKELIKNEKAWYVYVNNSNIRKIIYGLTSKDLEDKLNLLKCVSYERINPIIYDNDANSNSTNSILIEYKKYFTSINDYFINMNNKLKENNCLENTFNDIKLVILKNIIQKINYLHSLEVKKISNELFYKNLEIEIFNKIIKRKKNIDMFINYFGPIKTVNNIVVNSFDVVLEKCKKIIYNYYKDLEIKEGNNKEIELEYRIIHGDCQFSNILINKSNITDICLIDPRGYFGESMIFGPVEYDFAKLLYGISGYDAFNSEYFIIDSLDNSNLENISINFTIPEIKFDKKILDKYFKKVHFAYVVIIWLGLADYSKNNIWKCLASYYHGLYLGTLL